MAIQRTRVPFALVLIACVAAGASGCSRSSANVTQSLKVAMVTDVAGLGDKSFNDSAYAGLQAAKRAFGADIDVLESKSAADYQPNLTVLADEDYDQIIAVGFLMSKDLKTIALNYPKRHFAIVDAVVDEPNVSSVVFREQEGAFLAGALAAAFSRTKTIGFLGGVDVPLLRKFEAGYVAGARQVDPAVKVLVKYVGSFEDVPSGKELASVMYGDGADVIFVAAGKSGLGAIDEARERAGAYAIGVDSDQDALAPGKVLTSMVKHVDVAVFDLAAEAHGQKQRAGTMEFGLANGGVGLTDFRYTKQLVGTKTLARLAKLDRAIIDGTIEPPSTREALASWKPAPGL
jgi:basic membrane protein A